MLWRCNWVKQRKKILNAATFSSIHGGFSRENHSVSHGIASKPLTHDYVYSRLRNSTSDLKKLSFFFWCAKQSNYFHDDRAFDHMTSVLENLTRDHNSIDPILTELKRSGFVIKPRVYLLLLEILWRGHVYEKAIEVFISMKGFGYEPNTRAKNMVMDVLFKANDIHQALAIFEGIRVRNFFSFDIALSHLCSRGDLVKVKIVLKMMIRERFYPNTERFGQVLGLFCSKGRVFEGFQVLGLMICSGVSVSVNVWSMLFHGFFRLGEPEKAVRAFDKMVQIGYSPNLVTYTTLIKGFMDFGMVDEAFTTLRSARGLAPDIVICNVMIHTFTKLGRFDDARKVFANLEKWKLSADRYTFASIVSSLSSSRDFKLLTRIADGLEIDLDLVTGNSLVNFFAKCGNFSRVLSLVCDMSRRDLVDCYTYAGFLTALVRGGRASYAVNIYEEMVRKGTFLDAHVHTAIIDSLIEVGKYDTANRLFNRCVLNKSPLDVVSYTVAIKGLVRAKRFDEACSMLSRMKENGVYPNGRSYRTIISGLCEEKENGLVKEIVRECIQEGVELDPNTKVKVISLLSRSRRDSSEFKSVFEKWVAEFTEGVDVCDSGDELSVSVG